MTRHALHVNLTAPQVASQTLICVLVLLVEFVVVAFLFFACGPVGFWVAVGLLADAGHLTIRHRWLARLDRQLEVAA